MCRLGLENLFRKKRVELARTGCKDVIATGQ
jgi:hypothetical protein